MKKNLLTLLSVLLLVACSKGTSVKPVTPVVLLDVIGKWALQSEENSVFAGGNQTVGQYPCIAYNITTFNSDSTFSSTYTGAATCYVANQTTLGIPGQAINSGTWHRNGNDIYIGIEHYVISNPNGKLTLNFTASFTSGGVNYSEEGVLLKIN